MNYIGSKYSLIDFLETSIDKTLKLHNETKQPSGMVFADLFAGTGVVSGSFKKQGYSIIANDIQYYSYVITKHMIENNGNLDKSRCKQLIEELDHLQGVEGFIYKNYSYEGTEGQNFVGCIFLILMLKNVTLSELPLKIGYNKEQSMSTNISFYWVHC